MAESKYYFGKGEYKDVLTCLSTTKVNSYKTSSLPLAQFWEPNKKLGKFIILLNSQESIDISNSDRYFEYPTPCEKNGEKLESSSPSMTDLMIINEKYQIAIEGKYTEYSEGKYQTINEWNNKNAAHKENIKNRWFEYIKECGATSKESVDGDIPYQFLHRTASACYKCAETGKIPVLIYQLFYDSSNEEKKDDFVKELKKWAEELGFTEKIQFLVVEVNVNNIKEIMDKYEGVRSDLFLIMKELKEPIYQFDWDNIKITKL